MKRIGLLLRRAFHFLFWSLFGFMLFLPAWILLILHFTVGISIWWFWGALGVWIVIRILRMLLIRFARWGAGVEEDVDKSENKNPYSHR